MCLVRAPQCDVYVVCLGTGQVEVKVVGKVFKVKVQQFFSDTKGKDRIGKSVQID